MREIPWKWTIGITLCIILLVGRAVMIYNISSRLTHCSENTGRSIFFSPPELGCSPKATRTTYLFRELWWSPRTLCGLDFMWVGYLCTLSLEKLYSTLGILWKFPNFGAQEDPHFWLGSCWQFFFWSDSLMPKTHTWLLYLEDSMWPQMLKIISSLEIMSIANVCFCFSPSLPELFYFFRFSMFFFSFFLTFTHAVHSCYSIKISYLF